MTPHIKHSPPLPCYLRHNPQYTSWHSTLSTLRHSHVTSTLLAPNISLCTQFWNTNSLFSASNIKRKFGVLYILNFLVFKAKGETEWSRGYANFSLLLIFHEFNFWIVRVVPKYLKFQNDILLSTDVWNFHTSRVCSSIVNSHLLEPP